MFAIVEVNKDKDEQEEKVINVDTIAYWYKQWIMSGPFDIGTTTIGGLRPIALAQTPLAYIGKQNATEVNQQSLSNGSLMRCTPMAVWTSTLEDPS